MFLSLLCTYNILHVQLVLHTQSFSHFESVKCNLSKEGKICDNSLPIVIG